MKILFLTDNFPPEVNAPANRTFEHCLEWVKKGIEVTVITSFPNFPKGKVYDGYKNKFFQIDNMNGIKVIRVWTFITSNSGFYLRILDYLSFSFSSFIAGLFIKTDIIIATSPQFFTAVTGRWLSLFKKKPWIFEVRDIWPESIIAVGVMKKNILIQYLEWVEKRLYKSSNHIVVVTDSFKDYIIRKGISEHKISIFKNGCNFDYFNSKINNKNLKVKLGLNNKFIFGYIGTHGLAHGLDFLINAISKIKEKKFHFLFIGDGSEKENLIKKSKNLDLDNLTFVDSLPKNKLLNYFNIIDVCIVNLKKNKTFLSVIPSKIFEAAAMQKPILLGLEGESKKIIKKYNAGIVYRPENLNDLIKSIFYIYNKRVYDEKIPGLKRLSKAYDRKKIATQYLNLIKKI